MPSRFPALSTPDRLLMGAGPSNVDPRVLQAMTSPLLGHLDPDFLRVMDEVREMLRDVFLTSNTVTLPIPGTGTAGMEAALVNILEPGDTLVVATNGYFGSRLADIGRRCGANAIDVPFPPGQPADPAVIREVVKRHDRVKGVAVVHAETSTGALTPLPEIGEVAHEAGALFIVDAVTSLGGIEVRVDDWDIDVCYSGTQKCVGCPPGLAPLTVGERALQVMDSRKTTVQSFYLDLTMLRRYWQQRAYHHTAPVAMIYALHEALRLLLDEGLEQRWARHTHNAQALWSGIEAMGLDIVVPEPVRTTTLTAIGVPNGVVEADVRRYLLERHSLEISGGLGDLAGRIWRVGLMGHNNQPATVLTFLSAFENALQHQGYELATGAALAAAQHVLRNGTD